VNTDTLKKLGGGGTLLAFLCCMAGPLLISGLASVGLGLALPSLDVVLLPLGLAAILLYGYAHYREHSARAHDTNNATETS
jgi:hypothetical protein